jgi:hypothetical protein
MIHVYNNPSMLDFLKIAARMPDDERKQIEAASGEPYDIDGVAVGNYCAPGPKWVIKADEVPLVVGGFVLQRRGVWQDFLLTTPEAWVDHWFSVTRVCRRLMDAMLQSGQAHRLQCIVPVLRMEGHPKLWGWYEVLGYHKEGLHHGYYASGADAYSFARVKH